MAELFGVATGGDEDPLDDIYQKIEPSLKDAAALRTFAPWHKPRKHYIRLQQWCELVKLLIRSNGMSAGQTLRYLGMPGDDFLDIRALESVCGRESVKLHFLGFDVTADADPGQYEINISRNEVSALEFIDPLSVVLKDRIEKIGQANSPAAKQVQHHGTFDVVNIDLCNSAAADCVGNTSYFDAFHHLCNSQTKGRTKPWLLFLTTRAGRDHIEEDTKAKLLQCVLENVNRSNAFATRLRSELSLDGKLILDEITNSSALAHAPLVQLFGLSLGKWLLRIMMSAQPHVHVRLLDSFSYRVSHGEPDMLALAFAFEPVIGGRVDPSGLVTARPPAAASPSEPELAEEMIARIESIVDVDTLLADEPELNDWVTRECADLLASARYDKDAYIAWARNSIPAL